MNKLKINNQIVNYNIDLDDLNKIVFKSQFKLNKKIFKKIVSELLYKYDHISFDWISYSNNFFFDEQVIYNFKSDLYYILNKNNSAILIIKPENNNSIELTTKFFNNESGCYINEKMYNCYQNQILNIIDSDQFKFTNKQIIEIKKSACLINNEEFVDIDLYFKKLKKKNFYIDKFGNWYTLSIYGIEQILM